LLEVKDTVADNRVVDNAFRRLDCSDISEVNYYQDWFQSSIHVQGSVGVSSGVEFIGNGVEEYVEAELEFNMPITENGNGDIVVDPSWADALLEVLSDGIDQEIAAWFSANPWIWWIFSDSGYGSSDTFQNSGLPCDQWEDIKGWINHTVAMEMLTAMDNFVRGAAATVACFAESILTGGMGFFAFAFCVAANYAAAYFLEASIRVGNYMTLYWLDCIADIIAPTGMAPSRFYRPTDRGIYPGSSRLGLIH
jgi:hypothetical protein